LGKTTVKEKEKALIIYELRHEFKIKELLNIAQIKKSTYYYHLSNMSKEDKYAKVKEEIESIYRENKGIYGYRRITIALTEKGYMINHKTVQRLMQTMGLKSMVRMKKYKSYKGEVGKIAPNILKRDFKANQPNQKWVTDVTEFALCGQKIYLSPIVDLYNGEVISYNISDRPVFKQVTDMLEKAFAKIPDNTHLILHSDQGWQYQMRQYQRMLKEKGITQSMSRKGNCLDNSLAENFFSHLKSELLYIREFETIDEFKEALIDYIEYYNNKRIKLKLKMSPVAYRLKNAA
jgi:transposase InsO family protein